MKVLCIVDEGWMIRFLIIKMNASGPSYGEVYDVTGQFRHNGKTFYELAGWPSHYGFESSGFIPISDTDEREFVREGIGAPLSNKALT
jgi:hypothetical protein